MAHHRQSQAAEKLTAIFLPSRSPELNPVENVWQYLGQNWLSNRVFDDYDAIIDAACEAWQKLSLRPKPPYQSERGSGRTSVKLHGSWYHERVERRKRLIHQQSGRVCS